MSDDGDGHSHLQQVPQHQCLVTGDWTNRRFTGKLNVRCRCMAEYKNVSMGYYSYDWLAQVDRVEQVGEVYRRHLRTGETRIVV